MVNTFNYLGSRLRFNDAKYSRGYKTVVTGGRHGRTKWYLGQFSTDAIVHEFSQSISKLRNNINGMNEKYQSSMISREEYIYWLHTQWIPQFKEFIKVWGKEFITKDLRWGLNDVEKHIGMSLTSWPVMPELESDEECENFRWKN